MNGLVKVALAGDGLGDYIFGLDPQLLVDSAITILAMFAMFLLLSYLLFNPARDLLQKRQAYIKEQLEEAGVKNPVFVTCIGPVVGTHIGPNSLGIGYIEK